MNLPQSPFFFCKWILFEDTRRYLELATFLKHYIASFMENHHGKGPEKAGKRILRSERQLKLLWRWSDKNGFEISQYKIDKGRLTGFGMKNKSKVVS